MARYKKKRSVRQLSLHGIFRSHVPQSHVDLLHPFAALERVTLSDEEARLFLATTDQDKAKIQASDAKRQRKADILRRTKQ